MTTAPAPPAGAPRARGAVPAQRRPAAGRRPAATASRRLRVGRVLLVAVLGIATLKLVVIQSFQAPDLNAASARQLLTEIPLPAERGPILDSAGKPLAFSIEANALVTNPRTIARTHGAGTAEYVTRMASAVGQATGQDPAALQALLTADKGYVVLAKLVDPGVAQAMHDQFPEIALERRESRQYPGGSLAANVIGAATWDATDSPGKLTGRVGLESSQDNLLSGSNGVREVDTAEGSSAEIPGSVRYERPAVPGSTLQLTLDSDLQYTVQRELSAYVAKTGARDNSSAVVLDVATGKVRALATGKTFDPSNPGASAANQLGNPAVTSPYEPGSVNKIVTMSAAIEYGVAKPDDVLDVPGSIRVADRTINDAWKHGLAALHAHRGAGEVVERRHDHDGAEGGPGALRRHAGALRARPEDRGRAAGREPGQRAADGDLVRLDVRQPADRPGPVHDGAADGGHVPGRREQRAAHPAADRRGHGHAGRRAHRPARARGGAGGVAADGRDAADDAHRGHAGRRTTSAAPDRRRPSPATRRRARRARRSR